MIRVDVRVVSFGGVGCTYIMKKLQENNIITNSITDKDGFKHLPHKSMLNKQIEADKTIYVYNDPIKAVLSHYRRKWHLAQHRKITNPENYLNSDILKYFDVFQDKSIDIGKEIYGVEQHFYDWYENEKHNKEFLFIDFRNDCDERVSHFIGCNIVFKLKNRSPILEVLKDDFVAIYSKTDTTIKEYIDSMAKNQLMATKYNNCE